MEDVELTWEEWTNKIEEAVDEFIRSKVKELCGLIVDLSEFDRLHRN